MAAGQDGSQELLNALLPRGIKVAKPLNLHSMGVATVEMQQQLRSSGCIVGLFSEQ
jgi:hypothetical protein